MGLVHESYLVNRRKLSALLDQKTTPATPEERINARSAARPMIEAGRSFLLNVGDPEPSENDAWLTYLIADCVTGMRALRHSSVATLELVLPLLGWTTDEVYAFLIGRPFTAFVRSFHDGSFGSYIQPATRVLGWLNSDHVSKYEEMLRRDKQLLLDPSRAVLEVLQQENILSQLEPNFSVRNSLASAFAESLERVESALNESCDLLLYNDTPTYRSAAEVHFRLREFWA